MSPINPSRSVQDLQKFQTVENNFTHEDDFIDADSLEADFDYIKSLLEMSPVEFRNALPLT